MKAGDRRDKIDLLKTLDGFDRGILTNARCLIEGDRKLKAKIAQADRINRGGLAVLQNALKNRGVTLTGKLADILQSCIADQEFWQKKQQDHDRIHKRRNGTFQVQVTIEEVRYSKTFDDLADAQRFRDRMILLGWAIAAENTDIVPSDK
jgi:hypothetical protein